ncbi:hypothetical protein MNBD_DELTA01-1793 [hydrothermal vent metagenome]|uniref:Ice-binding protein C-terminal domain-containing protein n=1 Tax=hydrothermal vent metagenome TaxID=652676 RepID=A0A3B0QZL6_9ZZZZ
MKKLGLLTAVFTLALMAYSIPAQAIPSLHGGPLFAQFANREQISASGSIVAPSGFMESNWGVAIVSNISEGVFGDPQNFDPASSSYWENDGSDGQVTAIWGHVMANPGDGSVPLASSGGSMYLYWDNTTVADLATATVADRTGDFTFTNFTDGTLLAKIDFLAGAITPDPLTTIAGSVIPTAGGFTGVANLFANVDLAAGGLWATLLDTNYFNSLLGLGTADMKLRTIYESTGSHPWDDPGAGVSNDIFGAQSTDPLRAYVVPEPSTIVLLGMGLLGAGFVARRRNKKKA